MPTVKILIAQSPQALAKTEKAFSGYDILTAFDIKAADYWIQRHQIDAFIIGVHFDESRGVELASLIRTSAKQQNKPIIMVRLLASENSHMFRTTFGALIETDIINAYLDFDEDDDSAPDKIRQCLDEQLQIYREKNKPLV